VGGRARGAVEEAAPRPPSPQQQQAAATVAQTGELTKIRKLLERQERDREPGLTYAALDQRMTWDGGNKTNDRSLKWLAFFKAFPALMAQMTRIPDDYWSREAEKEEGIEVVMAVVRCPCGTDTIVELGDSAECAGTQKSGAPCKRFYLYLVDRVYVANSPKQRVAPWEAIVDDYRQSDRPDS
jgi:hypothetical protein